MQLIKYKANCSGIGKIIVKDSNITEKQSEKITELEAKEKLTSKQQETLNGLIKKRDTPVELSTGAKSEVDKWIKEKLFKRRKQVKTKYMDKGNSMEDWSIDFIAKQLNYKMLIKNSKRETNEFVTGEADVLPKDCCIDAKNSWDHDTFPFFETEFNKDYYWQGQGYMWLFDRKDYKLCYVLSNTPESLILSEAKSYCFKNNIEFTDEIFNKFYSKMTYDDLPDSMRLKKFEFKRSEKDIELIKTSVNLCQEYVNNKIEQYITEGLITKDYVLTLN